MDTLNVLKPHPSGNRIRFMNTLHNYFIIIVCVCMCPVYVRNKVWVIGSRPNINRIRQPTKKIHFPTYNKFKYTSLDKMLFNAKTLAFSKEH